MKDETKANHPPHVKLCDENAALVYPIYQSAKFSVSDARELRKSRKDLFLYSRVSNPTVRQLELLLADLQGVADGIAVSSGVAAISSTLLSLLRAGDHALIFLESYKPSRTIVTQLLGKFGVKSTIVSITERSRWTELLSSGTVNLILFESVTNPITRLVDFNQIAKLGRKNNVITVMDNTFAGFHNCHHPEIDVYLHSLTKFAGGHGDVMGGAILGSKSIIQKIHQQTMELGPTLDPHAAYLILRGMKTFHVRYREHSKNALLIAEMLSAHSQVERVYYPGLTSHPDYALAKESLKEHGCVVAFDLAEDGPPVDDFLNRLKLFKIAVSLGSTESLAAPVWMYATDLTEAQKKLAGICERGVRLSVGIEAIDDLVSDLKQAFTG